MEYLIDVGHPEEVDMSVEDRETLLGLMDSETVTTRKVAW